MTTAELIAMSIGILGVAGLVFTALKYNRDDTTAIVNQQTEILGNMKTLNEELRESVDDLRQQRDDARAESARLSGQVEALRVELRSANERIAAQVTQVQRTLDDG